MTFDEMILRPARPAVAAWLARLADRVADLREQARLGVIEAVGRTAAEAVEWLLQAALDVAPPFEPAAPDPPDGFDGEPYAEDTSPSRPTLPPRPVWGWRLALVAALHAARGWVRHWAPPPVAAVAAALIGAAAVLLD